MLITSNPVGGSAHVLSDALHSQAEQAQPHASEGPQPPPIKANPLESFTATNGLHPAAVDTMKGSADNAQRAGKPNPGKMNFEHYFDKASAGGLHPIAGGQATATARTLTLHDLGIIFTGSIDKLKELLKKLDNGVDDEQDEDEGD